MAIFVAVVGAAVAACTQPYPQNYLSPAGPIGEQTTNLFFLVFWIAVGVFVVVEGLLVYALIRFRRRRPDERPIQLHGNTRLEVAWTLAPALLLAVVAVPTIGTIFALARGAPADAMEIRVTGHQWWWEVEYPEFGFVTANEIHIPAGEPVRVLLTSKDVLHSFSVPRLIGKQDLVPGRTSSIAVEADRPGVYPGQCYEFCGLSHYLMKFEVIAQPEEEFQAWVAGQQEEAPRPTKGSEAEEGAQLFQNFTTGRFPKGSSCLACHTVDPAQGGTVGPNLAHVGSRRTIAGASLANNPEDMARWLADPPGVKPGSRMPDYGLTEEQIEDLIAYLRTLR